MPVIDTKNETVKAQTGLHLYHFWLSSCSQRVRVVLAEKNLQWVDHPVDISPHGMEHATEEFQSINPKGVVPVLVHDGKIIIESIDIISYLDEHFPEKPLVPENDEAKLRMQEWLDRADAAQHSIKTLTHEFLLKDGRMNAEQLADFLERHHNRELTEFMKVFCSEEGIPRSEVEHDLKVQHDAFVLLDTALKHKTWLVDETFSLADVAWIPNVRRLELMGYPLERHPHLLAWFERIQERQSYYKGVSDCEIPPAVAHFKEYVTQRLSENTGIISYKPLV